MGVERYDPQVLASGLWESTLWGEGSMGAQGQTPRMGVRAAFAAKTDSCVLLYWKLWDAVNSMGVALSELGEGSSPHPESHKAFMKATASSLHHMEAGYSSPLCTPTPLPLKIGPHPWSSPSCIPVVTSKSGRRRP